MAHVFPTLIHRGAMSETLSIRLARDDGLTLERDPRTKDWFFSGNFALLSAILVGYVYVVKVAGPRFMRHREPMHGIKAIIMAYNAVMVAFSAYFTYNIARRSYLGGGYSPVCQGLHFDNRDRNTMELLEFLYWYMWVRLADFLDTLFFVLRKKDSHVSVLHVTHHCLVVFTGWFGLTYGADGHVVFCVCINGFIHVVMYSYYFLSLLGPSVRRYLWWKKYLTQLQLLQFAAGSIHTMLPLLRDCGYPRIHTYICIAQGIFFFVMFMNFYQKAYVKRTSQRAKAE
ncbi:very long chain fatty acid elongase AAEL008004-like [Ornithodoros turicata]|uniref:very long chain fatty acid elongase AAEL008004-like n=1 Tax=Ornithodoros turicata TaxID=34597 RepID=UPI0031393956